MPQEILSEERRVREVQIVGYLLHGELRAREQRLGLDDYRLRYPLRSVAPRCLTCDDGEVLGRYAELVGVILHLARDGYVGGQQREKPSEKGILPRAWLTLDGVVLRVYCGQFVTERKQDLGVDLHAEGVLLAGVLAAHHLAKFEYAVGLLLSEHNARIIAYEHVERCGRRDVYVVYEVDVDGYGVALEGVVGAERLEDRTPEGQTHRARLQVVFLLVDDDVTLALQTEEYAAQTYHVGHVLLLVEDGMVVFLVDKAEQVGFGRGGEIGYWGLGCGNSSVHRQIYFSDKYTNIFVI